MGRRSLARERRGQIIAVTIQCMATHGVAGTTLERIAEMAGMARGHVRHFVGNRDDLLIDAARVFFFGEDAAEQKDLGELLRTTPVMPPHESADEALDYLFGEFAAPGADNAAAIAFVDASRTMPAVHDIVLSAYVSIQTALTETLLASRAGLSGDIARATAYGILTVAIGNTFMTDLEYSEQRVADARAAADALMAALPLARTAG